MRRKLLLMMLTVSLSAGLQSQTQVSHEILIRNNHNYTYLRIKEHTGFTLRTTSGKEYSGRFRSLRADTVFLPDSFLLVSDIESLFISRGPFESSPLSHGGKIPDYVAGSPDQELIYPPDSVYRNETTYYEYLKKLYRKANHEKREKNSPFYYRNFLKFNLAKLAHLELAVSYERLIARDVTWETELSAILGITSADAYYFITYPILNYSGFSITTYPKYYFPDHNAYVGVAFMYRYLWVTGIRTDWPDQADNGSLQDQYRNDYGGSIRLGVMKRYGKFVFDCYLGGGIKYVFLHQAVYGDYRYHDSGEMHWRHADHSPDVYDRNLWQPVINLGIKLGFAF